MIILSATGDLINLTRSAAMMRQSSLIFVPSNIEMILDHVLFQVQITAVYLLVNTDPTAEQGTPTAEQDPTAEQGTQLQEQVHNGLQF